MSEKQRSSFNLTLKTSEESQLLSLYHSFADSFKHIPFLQFVKLCYDKQIISNKSPLHHMLNIFLQSAGDKPYLNKSRFFFAINLIGRTLYPEEILPLDPTLSYLLSEISYDSKRIPKFDDLINTLLSEGILKLFEETESGFFNILLTYNSKNIRSGRKTVGNQVIKEKNLGISPRNLIRYFRMKKDIIPAIVSISDLEKIIQDVVPPLNTSEKRYYLHGYLRKFYEQDSQTTRLTMIKDIPGEPDLKLCDLQLVFGKIALLGLPGIENPYDRVYDLFITKLSLKGNIEIDVKYSFEQDIYIPFGEIQKPKEILKEYENSEYTKVENSKEPFDILSFINPVPAFPKLEELEKFLDFERVPQIPELQITIPENPPPFALPPIQHPISSPTIKMPGTPKSEQKINRSETPDAKIKFIQIPGYFHSKSPEASRFENFERIRRNLNSNLVPQTFHNYASNPSSLPCLIKEVYSLPDCPENIETIIDSCYAYISKKDYKSALVSILRAKNDLLKTEKKGLKPDANLFFELTKASIFESCRKYKLALGQYFESKALFEGLSFNNPDNALLYCGLGYTLHHLNHLKLSTRSYLMAKRIRERCIGGDTIESATVYNNLGVCMFGLKRYQESHAYFQLSQAIYLNMLGPNNPRTNTVCNNILKVKRQNLIPSPEFKLLWSKQFVDPFAAVKKKKEKKKSKKGKNKD